MGGYWSYPDDEADTETLKLRNELLVEIRETRDTPVELRQFSGSPQKCGVTLGHVLSTTIASMPALPRATKPMWIEVKRKKKKKIIHLP